MDPVTAGPVVNQYMQTSAASVFACGNVVHVNDLVDNVSMESEIAGCEAARYALGTLPATAPSISCQGGANVRYICPQHIDLNAADRDIDLYFRVSSPQSKVRITAHLDNRELCAKKALKVNPGEMERLTIKSGDLRPGKLTSNVKET
jgi:hypothetical protein